MPRHVSSLRALPGTLAALVVAIHSFSTGCSVAAPEIKGSFIRIEAQELSLLRGQEGIQAVVYTPPPFDINTGATPYAVGGVLGIGQRLADTKEAATIQRDLEDPAVALRDRFLAVWRTEFSVTNVAPYEPPLPAEAEDLATLRTKFAKGTILDFRTTLWQMRLDLTAGAGRYRVDYQARGRLVHLDDGRVLWQGWCNLASQSAPQRSQLVADKGALLRAMFQATVESCVKELWAQMVARKG